MGVFLILPVSACSFAVFPTLVGVFLLPGRNRQKRHGLPHARGGVSMSSSRCKSLSWSSPRSWGCFSPSATLPESPHGLPHARGGVSKKPENRDQISQSSPRSWGCFRDGRGADWRAGVFPTLVGVFLVKTRPIHAASGSSPRSWGCFPFT